jgi:diguanylate cyclase (GGDEF)-like protein
VANRRRGNAQLRAWPHAVLGLVDLDHFKNVNDELGHAAGDDVLRRFAVALARHARAGDLVCRWGGEEFLIALPEGSEHVLVELLDRVRDDVTDDRIRIRIGFSAGVAQRQTGERLADCLARADRAMYSAKRAGRGRTLIAASADKQPVPAPLPRQPGPPPLRVPSADR